MKKFISFLTVAVLLVTMMATVAFAAESATITVAKETVEEGTTTVDLTVNITEATYAAYGMKVEYDSSVLTLKSITQGSATPGMFIGNANTGKVACANATNNTVSGNLFTLSFEIAADAAPGEYAVTLAVDSVGTEVKEILDITVVAGGVVIEGEEPTEAPTEEPTEAPTEAPTEEPTEAPTEEPTEAPTEAPTEEPTEEPTEAPTEPKDDGKDDEPKTGDIAMMYTFGFIAVFCVLAAAFVAVKSKAAK